MSMIEVTRDEKNLLLSRREITCTFKGLAGKLKKLEAADMIAKQFNLEGKIVIPVLLRNENGRPMVSGTFYVYEDENLAKKHLKVAIFKRLEKAKAGPAKAQGEPQEAPAEKTEGKPAEKKEGEPKAEGKPKEEGKPKQKSKPKEDSKQKEEGQPKAEGKPKEDSK